MSEIEQIEAELERVIAAMTDELEARRQARRERHLRSWTKGFATCGSFSGPTEDVARILDALEPLAKARFDAARQAGEHEHPDAYRFDAMVTLADVGPGESKKPQPHAVRVRVDLPALLRGRTAPGETCEILGVGPVARRRPDAPPVGHSRSNFSRRRRTPRSRRDAADAPDRRGTPRGTSSSRAGAPRLG
jgi:hypothetical protein